MSDTLWDALVSAPSALQLIGCEVVGCKRQFLSHFVGGQLVPVPEMELERAELNEADHTLTVFVKRQLPLSSSHGGQPLQLAFAIAATGDVAFTEPFTVLAKQGRAGTQIKILRSKPSAPVNVERARARETIATVVTNSGLENLPGSPARAAGSTLHGAPLSIDVPTDRSSSPAGMLPGMPGMVQPSSPADALAFTLSTVSRAAVSTSLPVSALADTLVRAMTAITSSRPSSRQLEQLEAHESPRNAKRSRLERLKALRLLPPARNLLP